MMTMLVMMIIICESKYDLQEDPAWCATAKEAARTGEKMGRVRLLKMLAALPLLRRSDHHHHHHHHHYPHHQHQHQNHRHHNRIPGL